MLRRLFFAGILLLAAILPSHGQYIIMGPIQGNMGRIHATVVDSTSLDPLPYASVYLIPRKDTTITNFTLTDTTGVAKLEEVPYGAYSFHVELMGYVPVVKEVLLLDWMKDMGMVKLKVDDKFLEAAVVTDVGNPIVVKQDTIEYNASSFRVGSNAVLKDLLAKMPGFEFTDDGKVKVNGEAVDRITVNGRTFFLGDQSTTLNNLPAKVVDKIRVIDKDTKQKQATGVDDGSKEKVMDVALKKEYEKGWFGNIGAMAGTNIPGKDKRQRDYRGFLFNANAMVSNFNPKDQVTLIANGINVSEGIDAFVAVFSADDAEAPVRGLTTGGQLAGSFNTVRIKDVESSFTLGDRYSGTTFGSETYRTTYQDAGNLYTESSRGGYQGNNSLNCNMEFEKTKGRFTFTITPAFTWRLTSMDSESASKTERDGSFLNSSSGHSASRSSSLNQGLNSRMSFSELGGKKGRSVTIYLIGGYGTTDGTSSDYSETKIEAGAPDIRDLHYIRNSVDYSLASSFEYSEPIAEKLILVARTSASWYKSDSGKDAFNADGSVNEYYSSVSNNDYISQNNQLTLQYNFAPRSSITFGAQLQGILNKVYSKSFGTESTTGEGEWLWTPSPILRLNWFKNNTNLRVSVSGYNSQPSRSRMLPVLDISNPVRISAGNTYLKTSTMIYSSASLNRSNPKRFSSLYVYFQPQVTFRPIVNALWYDSAGRMYSVPVNSKNPSISLPLYGGFSTPLDKRKRLTFSLDLIGRYTALTSYQTSGAAPSVSLDSFEYDEFMSAFWGNDSSGSVFYGGGSGFQESKTDKYNTTVRVHFKYNLDAFHITVGYTNSMAATHYSLDRAADMITTSNRAGLSTSYITKHEFELGTEFNYNFYTGYSGNYGLPEWHWNASITKNIGAFSLSFKAVDILNQTRNLDHTATDDYTEDTYSLVLGRHFLLGFKWNFGKMNAANSRRAQNAAWRTMF